MVEMTSGRPVDRFEHLLKECQRPCRAVPSKTSFLNIRWTEKQENQLAIHPPQQHLSNVKITLHMVVNIPQESERVTFTRGVGGGGVGIPFLVHFSLSSTYIVSKCLSHEGKATVTQLQIHKKQEQIPFSILKQQELFISTQNSFVFFFVINLSLSVQKTIFLHKVTHYLY